MVNNKHDKLELTKLQKTTNLDKLNKTTADRLNNIVRRRDDSITDYRDDKSKRINFQFNDKNRDKLKRDVNQKSKSLGFKETEGKRYQSVTRNRCDSASYPLHKSENLMPKVAVNFPPLRAPQSIVNVRHPFVTESRSKDSGVKVGDGSVKDLSRPYYGTSVGLTYRPETYPSVVYPESQFHHSPTYNSQPINQYPYDPGSYATNPVISQFPESSMGYGYEGTQYVQGSYSDVSNSQYQYQGGMGQLQDTSIFVQNLQSPIAVTEQYNSSYARAVRTDLIPRLRRPTRFNK